MLGSAAGVAFAPQAAVTKVFMTAIGHGVPSLLADRTPYAEIGRSALTAADPHGRVRTPRGLTGRPVRQVSRRASSRDRATASDRVLAPSLRNMDLT